jgi:hypothetical protein
MTNTLTVAAALARVPRSGSLHEDIHAEATVLVKKLRPLLNGFRLGSVVRALLTLAAEYSTQLLRVERRGCDCISDSANGLFRCDSNRYHAVTEIVTIEEKNGHAQRNKN